MVEFAVTAPGGEVISELDHDAGKQMHLITFRRDSLVTSTSCRSRVKAPPGRNSQPHARPMAGDHPFPVASARSGDRPCRFTVSGDYRPEALPPAADQVPIKGLTVTRTGELRTSANSGGAITVTDDG